MISNVDGLKMAYRAARLSNDRSTQNGAVVVSATGTTIQGCNNAPNGVHAYDERLESPLKYLYTEHAERAAILRAARYGVPLYGSTMFAPWAACADCARAIIVSGISRLVVDKPMMDGTPERWKESINHAFGMLEEADVEIVVNKEPISNIQPILFNGEVFVPWG